MQQSKLYTVAQNQLKVQKGIKIMQYATEFYINRAFYRQGAVFVNNDLQNQANSKSQMTQIFSELNQQLINLDFKPKKMKQSQQKVDIGIKKTVSIDLHQPFQKQQSLNQNAQNDLDKYLAQQEKHIENDFIQFASHISDEQQKKLLSIIYQTQKESQIIQQSSKSISLSNIKKKEQGFIQKPQITPKKKIKNTSQTKLSSISNKSDKHPITIPIQISQTLSKKSKSINQQKDKNRSQSLILSNILDKSISMIHQTSSSNSRNSNLNQTELEIIKKINQNSEEEQTKFDQKNMQLLLRLQNQELKALQLERRIKKRLEKTYKDFQKISQISWQSLNMPKPQYIFRRPNYAHTS